MSQRMSKRLLGVLVMALLGLLVASPALAVEQGTELLDDAEALEEGPLPDIDEVGTQSDVALEFFPDGYEAPSVLPPILYALLGVAAIVALVLLVMFLVWQPRFAQERNRKTKGRR